MMAVQKSPVLVAVAYLVLFSLMLSRGTNGIVSQFFLLVLIWVALLDGAADWG